jgi:acyl dehydratase
VRFKSLEKVLTREDIKRFTAKLDPQPYHLDEAAAEKTPLKGFAASGWHSAAVAMRLAIELPNSNGQRLINVGRQSTTSPRSIPSRWRHSQAAWRIKTSEADKCRPP